MTQYFDKIYLCNLIWLLHFYCIENLGEYFIWVGNGGMYKPAEFECLIKSILQCWYDAEIYRFIRIYRQVYINLSKGPKLKMTQFFKMFFFIRKVSMPSILFHVDFWHLHDRLHYFNEATLTTFSLYYLLPYDEQRLKYFNRFRQSRGS